MDRKLLNQATSVMGLEIRSFAYLDASEPVLENIKLEIQPGSLTVIAGQSGSGKSTLGAVIAGLLPRHGLDRLVGNISVDGTCIEFSSASTPRIDIAQWAKHVGLLPQEAGHYLSGIRGTVAEELAFSLENEGVHREQIRQRVEILANQLRLEHLLQRHPAQLSGGQERLVALAALAMSEPELLVLDEPLAGLDQKAAQLVSDMINLLRAQGTALVILSGSVQSWAGEADSTWLLDGRTLQRLPENFLYHSTMAPNARNTRKHNEGRVLLNMESVQLAYRGASTPAVSDLDLQVRSGECLGLAGNNGSGKTTTLKAAAGLLPPSAGVLDVRGETGLLLQNSSDQLFERTVFREVSFGIPKKSPLRERAPEVLAQLGLESYSQTHPYELPASARRLVALATVLVREPQLLLLDEPTEALDSAGLLRLNEAIESVLERGGAVVFSSHDAQFMAQRADRIHMMTGSDNESSNK